MEKPHSFSTHVVGLPVCIFSDPKAQTTLIKSCGNEFTLTLVEHSGGNCVNPYFPSIHVKGKQKPNAWLYIVRTDNQMPEFQQFIDAQDYFPFYTHDPGFL